MSDHSSIYYPLFEHMTTTHNLTLLDSELEDICQSVYKVWGSGKECERLKAELAQARKETPTADAILWREACNKARDELAQAKAENARLAAVLQQWIAYSKSDIPRTAEEHEAAGEAFTKCWDDSMKLLKERGVL